MAKLIVYRNTNNVAYKLEGSNGFRFTWYNKETNKWYSQKRKSTWINSATVVKALKEAINYFGITSKAYDKKKCSFSDKSISTSAEEYPIKDDVLDNIQYALYSFGDASVLCGNMDYDVSVYLHKNELFKYLMKNSIDISE